METWDPKPDATSQFRGPFGAIPTSLPGVHFSELLPEQARRMDRMAIVRTVNHGTGDHTKGNHWMLTGYEGPAFNAPDNEVQRRPSMGSAVARLLGPGDRGLPPYVAVPHLRGGTDNLFHYAAYLGGYANPFIVESDPNDAGVPRQEPVAAARASRSAAWKTAAAFLESMDQLRRDIDPVLRDLDAYHQRAFDMLTGQIGDARLRHQLRAGGAPRPLRPPHVRPEHLLARRLVEAGTPFVTVNCVPWDHHGTPPQLKTEEGAAQVDPAARPRHRGPDRRPDRPRAVRIHAGRRDGRVRPDAADEPRRRSRPLGPDLQRPVRLRSMQMGQVIGRSSARGEYVVDRPISPQDVAATVYHHLGIDGRSVTFEDRTGRPTYLIESGEPIRELVG